MMVSVLILFTETPLFLLSTNLQQVTLILSTDLYYAPRIVLINIAFKSFASGTPTTEVTSFDEDYLIKLSIGMPPFQIIGILDTATPFH